MLKKRIVGTLCVTALLAVAVAGAGSPASAQEPKKIALGDVSKTASNWPTFVADHEGFFRKEGIAPDVIYVGNVANTVQQLVAGSFDVAISTFDTALRAAAKSGDVTLIGGMTVKYTYSVMTAKNIHTLQDLKGKTIILPFQKDFLTVIWNQWLVQKGMQPKDINQIYDGATPDRVNALIAGAAQAVIVNQPFDFQLEDQGYNKLLDIGKMETNFGFLGFLARKQWLKDNPDEARALLKAYAEATDWLYDPANRDEAIAILAQYSKTNPNISALTYDYYIRDLKPFSLKAAIPDGIVKNTVDMLIQLGDVTQKEVQGKTFVDSAFLPK